MHDGRTGSTRHVEDPGVASPRAIGASTFRKVGLRIAGAVALTLAVAGCGLNGTPAAAARSSHGSALAFAACMRSHGVPQFPDPNPQGGFTVNTGDDGGVNPSSSTFQNAMQGCQSLLPQGKSAGNVRPGQLVQAKQRALAFSQCMRAHGVPNFPDPKFSANGISLEIPSSVNPSSPAFQQAQAACAAYAPFHGHVPPRGKGGQGSGTTVVIP